MYYATSKPSWMSLNSSTGVLSGKATGTADSGIVSVYVMKGDYRSPIKSLSYVTINTLPKWTYSQIKLDVTGLVRGYGNNTRIDIDFGALCSRSSDTTFSLNKTEVIKQASNYKLSLDIIVTCLYITRKNDNGNNNSSSFSDSCAIIATNAYGSASIKVSFYVADKTTYKNNSSKYSSMAPIVTYS